MKAGLLSFNKEACELMRLEEGHQVEFAHDDDNEGDWFLFKVKKDGWALRRKDAESKYLTFNNTALCRKIAESVAFEGKSGKIIIVQEPKEIEGIKGDVWALITAGLRNS